MKLDYFTCSNGLCACDCRYDGQRAQIHKLADGCVRLYSRNGDESTSRFPDVINIIKDSCKPNVETFIIDAEVRHYCSKERHKHTCIFT